MLPADDGTSNVSYGYCSPTLYLGLKCAFLWEFTITEPSYLTVGVDFLQNLDLLVNDPRMKIIQAQTSPTLTGLHAVLNQIAFH